MAARMVATVGALILGLTSTGEYTEAVVVIAFFETKLELVLPVPVLYVL